MTYGFDATRFDRMVEAGARKITSSANYCEPRADVPPASVIEAFWYLARNDRQRLRAWMATRSPGEVEFFRRLWSKQT